MHREFDPADRPLDDRPSDLGLFAFTGLLVALLAADLWPPVAAALGLPSYLGRTLFGVRLALAAAFLGAVRILVAALEDITRGKIGADLAVGIASVAALLLGEPLVAAEVIVIALVGECLEAITFARTRRRLQGLAEMFPTRTWALRDGQEVRVFTTQLIVGDLVVVKPGGRVPVDGTVRDGHSALDTSALTGESLPREVGPGDRVLAGSVNRLGALTIHAELVAKQTVAGQVIERTAEALKAKAPLERYADRLARRFLPAVLTLTAAAFLANVGFQLLSLNAEGQRPSLAAAARVAVYPALAVLVVACPCALVLATPAAVIAALGRLAGTGVLVKGGAALERLAAVNAIAFDKTGTLTTGTLSVGDVLPLPPATADEVLRVAAAAEQRSEHPLARAVLAARQPSDAVTDFRAHPGAGVSATLDGAAVWVGTRRLLEANGLAVPPDAVALVEQLDAVGQSSLLVARDGVVLGAIGAHDTVRPEAAEVIAELKELGLSPAVMLTGDRDAAARAAAAALPLDAVHAELLPGAKADHLFARPIPSASEVPGEDLAGARARTDTARRFAYVGDGLNDAPALASSAVGLAVGGIDAAADAADVVLLGDPLRPLPLLVRLARQTVVIIRQNIIWFGFGVNLFGVLVAGFLWPLFAPSPDWFERAPLVGVLYHQIGSLAVLLNSMRLLRFAREPASGVARLQQRVRDLDRWLTTLHPDDALHELGHHWKPITVALSLFLAIGWAASGVNQIEANEVGVVRRFGAVRADLPSGLHVRWPWPIETVDRVRPAEVRTVELGFRLVGSDEEDRLRQAAEEQRRLRRTDLPGVSDANLTWDSEHAEGVAPRSDEALMITGDGNLLEVRATVRYTVADPRTFLFGTADPETVIRSTAETVLRELAAGRAFADVLTADRAGFERQATERLGRRLDTSSAGRLGVSLAGLTLHDLHPPAEVVTAYRSVAGAIQARDRQVNEAEADALRTRRRAEEAAVRLVRQAEAAAAAKRAEATAARDAFLAWNHVRRRLSDAEETSLTAEQESRVRAGEERTAVRADVERRRQELLAVRRRLTEFRLTVQATTAVLAGRDKVLIDADAIPGRRLLILADPEAARLPPQRPAAGDKEP